MCDKDCPKARSGGASFAAARVLEVPPQQMVSWLKRAELLFAKEVRIVWLPATRPETFVEWLGAARRAHLEYVPADSAQDASLARTSTFYWAPSRAGRQRGPTRQPWSCCVGCCWTSRASS
jgi:hypothetical protein